MPPISEVQSADTNPEGQMYRDGSTGLIGRASFLDACERAVALSARTKQPLSLALFDFDHFGVLNGLLGRERADRVLRHSVSTLESLFRRSDLLARWGEDEFVALFPHTDREGAVRAMEKALITIADQRFDGMDHTTPQVTFSAGVVEVSASVPVQETIAEALRFLQVAKAKGRNRILCADGEVAAPRRRVLLLSDDQVVSSVIRYRLERIDVPVVEVATGPEALAVANEGPVSLVVLDLNMRGTDGFALISEFRSARAVRGIPIVVLSHLGSERDMMRSFDLGADDYVHKPFSPDELIARIRRLLRVR